MDDPWANPYGQVSRRNDHNTRTLIRIKVLATKFCRVGSDSNMAGFSGISCAGLSPVWPRCGARAANQQRGTAAALGPASPQGVWAAGSGEAMRGRSIPVSNKPLC